MYVCMYEYMCVCVVGFNTIGVTPYCHLLCVELHTAPSVTRENKHTLTHTHIVYIHDTMYYYIIFPYNNPSSSITL